MSLVHRTFDGTWADCGPALLPCELKFHLPDTTVAEANSMPLEVILPLFDVIDPPQYRTVGGSRRWQQWEKPGGLLLHRGYGLPAIIEADGHMEWWVNGERHRAHGLPAIISAGGTLQEWWVDGQHHRDYEDGPAILDPENGFEWWVHGEFIHS